MGARPRAHVGATKTRNIGFQHKSQYFQTGNDQFKSNIQKVVFETNSGVQAVQANSLSPLPFCVYVVYLIYLSLSVSNILSVCSYMNVYEKCVFVRVYCMCGILEFMLVQIQSPFGPWTMC